LNFERKDNEHEYHFIWRVYSYMKDTGNITLAEAGEICNRELKLDYDESRHRKIYESFEKVWNQVRDEYVTEEGINDQLDDIDVKKDELYKQQVKTRDVLREKRKILRDEARIENLKDSFKSAYENADEVVFDKYESKHQGEKEAVLMLSDFHVGMVIDNYWNTYNTEVFKKRLNEVAMKVMRRAKIDNIGTLYVASLGDLISGSIHVTTRLAEELDVLDQVMFVAKSIKNLLKEFVDFGLNVKYLSVVGNHDRVNKHYKEHIEKESFNKIVDWYILDKIEDGILKIEYIYNEIEDEIGHFVINGEDCFFVHGHNDSVNSVVQNMIMATGIVPKYIFMGHWHSKRTDWQGNCAVFVNGNLMGVDDYGQKKRYFGKPSQSLIVFDDGDEVDIKINVE